MYYEDYEWFKLYKEKIKRGKILKIGAGLGYLDNFILLYNRNLITLDIVINKENIQKRLIKLYPGKKIPYKNESFDAVILPFSLHHIKNSRDFLKNSLNKSKKRVIIVEETYSTPNSKNRLIENDIKANKSAGQKVEIYSDSYFESGELEKISKEEGFKVELHKRRRRYSFYKELLVLKRKIK